MTKHVCVWIDNHQAKIFEIGREEAERQEVTETLPQHHIHRKADHVGLGHTEIDRHLLDGVAAVLTGADAILIEGPGMAKMALKSYLAEHHKAIDAKVWDVLTVDHPTDGELVAAARKWFHAQEGLHG